MFNLGGYKEVRHKQGEQNGMRNLLQKNIEMESQRTSIHICNSHKPTRKPKIAKEYAFSQLSKKQQQY